jgi:hypothetical protein
MDASDVESYYDVLEVEPSASSDAIEAAYRERLKETHPDKGSGDRELFFLVQEAYDVLGDEGTRAEYDLVGHDQFVGTDTATDETGEQTSSRQGAAESGWNDTWETKTQQQRPQQQQRTQRQGSGQRQQRSSTVQPPQDEDEDETEAEVPFESWDRYDEPPLSTSTDRTRFRILALVRYAVFAVLVFFARASGLVLVPLGIWVAGYLWYRTHRVIGYLQEPLEVDEDEDGEPFLRYVVIVSFQSYFVGLVVGGVALFTSDTIFTDNPGAFHLLGGALLILPALCAHSWRRFNVIRTLKKENPRYPIQIDWFVRAPMTAAVFVLLLTGTIPEALLLAAILLAFSWSMVCMLCFGVWYLVNDAPVVNDLLTVVCAPFVGLERALLLDFGFDE